MSDPPEHIAARDTLRRMVAGAAVDPSEVDRALAHAARCALCERMFEVPRTAACDDVEDDLAIAALLLREGGDVAARHPAVVRHVDGCLRCRAVMEELASEPSEPDVTDKVDPDGLFDQAVALAMTEREPLARLRAAERFVELPRPGSLGVAALARAAGADGDRSVRAAALRALGEVDTDDAPADHQIEAWAEDPDRALPYIAAVLARIWHRATPTVMRLTARRDPGVQAFAVAGLEGVHGGIVEEERQLFVKLRGLPPRFERTKPTVAFPLALARRGPQVDWIGERPGIIPSSLPVSDGALDIPVAHGSAPAGSDRLFGHLYLLTSE